MNRSTLKFILLSGLFCILGSPRTYAQSKGKIVGTVIEETSGTPLIGANVILMNTSQGASADMQGNYTISGVQPGNYQISASYLGYEEEVLEVTVQANQVTVVDFSLKESATELSGVTVYGQLTRGQAKALNEQKNAPNIKNVVSSEQFLLFPDRNAAETVARIPGISISYDQGEGELVQIRGLAPQYNSLTVNGQRIPAPDPDLGRAVGLDLLNQDLMENIVVTKALTPDIDGDAIGGNINFQMKQAPDEGIFVVNAGGGYNAQHSYFNEYGKDIVNLSGYAGQRFFDKKLGVLFAASYYKTNRGSLLKELEYDDIATGHIFAQHSNDYDVLRERTGFNLNTEFKFDQFNRIYLNLNHNRYFDKEIRRLDEWVIDDESEEKETRNRVEDQFLTNAMFGGIHNFNDIKLDYTGSWIKAKEDMPARTYFRFQRDFDFSGYTNDEIKTFAPNTRFNQEDVLTLNRIRVDDNLKEDEDISGMFNIEIPYFLTDEKSTIKFGGKYLDKSAKYTARRLQLRNFPEEHTLGEGEFGFIDVIVDPDDTGYLGATRAEYLDQSDDNYDANETVLAAYGMTTLNLTDKFTILAGLRYENTQNKYKTLATESAGHGQSDASYSNLLPSAHLTYRLNDRMNLRLAYSSGIARPDYVALVPYEFRDDDDREISKGNPDLKPTTSNNLDLMFESYSSSLGLFSAGIYYKKMTDIILNSTHTETLPYDGGSQVYEITMPINGDDDATVYGFEIALNQRLNFLNVPFLNYFSIYANYTYTKAEVKVDGRNLPMGYSPEHIANLALMYDNPKIGLSFVISNNFRDDILQSVGDDQYTDSYFKREYHLDLSVKQRITKNLSAFLQLNNLTDQEERQYYGKPSKDYAKLQQWAKFNSYGTLGLSFKL
ncbi:MAG: TonB-dependent receptor [Proteiniphilum acetatigenes]|uniref:TonB-dependent receptor n=1 Tax=Proteiniphilum acetatigenes TaxID=294710 RepID=A0A124FXE6_9BACT|nr:MAG: TonB-dependent receptor [Proteiniphilum acetatigenes]